MKRHTKLSHFIFSVALTLCAAASLPLGASAQTSAVVSSEKDNALTIVNLKDLKVEGTIATCKRPRHMQLTPDRKQLLVACGGDNAADVRSEERRVGKEC